jgi:hypothetical protein
VRPPDAAGRARLAEADLMASAAPRSESMAELGPVLPPSRVVQAHARELKALAARALEFSSEGPCYDLALAVKQFAAMRALLGDPA